VNEVSVEEQYIEHLGRVDVCEVYSDALPPELRQRDIGVCRKKADKVPTVLTGC
jgi:hypothetical protein